MCSVVGYIGKNGCRSHVIDGLSRLEYRGYDSAGFACLDSQSKLTIAKAEGKLSALVAALEENPADGNAGIGHTRWATHGASSFINAHPHFDCTKKISLVHNGIIENYHSLKKSLVKQDHVFSSQTDTEIVAHLIEEQLDRKLDILEAMKHVLPMLEGAFAFVVLMQDYPDRLLLVRKRSPLCIGIGNDEMFVASDAVAFAGNATGLVYLPDESFAFVSKDTVELYCFDGTPISYIVHEYDAEWQADGKAGHAHYMLKEIYEQKDAIRSTIAHLQNHYHNKLWESLGITYEELLALEKVNFIGCGTSLHAAEIAKYFFENIAMIQSQTYLASEFRYKSLLKQQQTIYIALSQSGETADTLECINMLKGMEIGAVALTNVSASTIIREATGFILTKAGREIAVASTKAFSTQIAALYWLAHRIALEKKIITKSEMRRSVQELFMVAEILEALIQSYKIPIFNHLAKRYALCDRMIFLGRHISYPFAKEAALKLQEIAYTFAVAYPAGELKHGPLALVDANLPVVVFSHQDSLIYKKLFSNVQEVKARNGHIIAFAFEDQKELIDIADTHFIIPRISSPLLSPLCMTGLMQLFLYAIAFERGCPIDMPRNLAKSVTVE